MTKQYEIGSGWWSRWRERRRLRKRDVLAAEIADLRAKRDALLSADAYRAQGLGEALRRIEELEAEKRRKLEAPSNRVRGNLTPGPSGNLHGPPVTPRPAPPKGQGFRGDVPPTAVPGTGAPRKG